MLIRARPLLGTLVEIRAAGGNAASVSRAITAAFDVIAEVHRLMSFHEPDSDVSRLNRLAHREAVQVDAQTWEVLACALELSRGSGGLFDCAIAPRLVRLGYLPRTPGVESGVDASSAHIELLAGHRVRFLKPLAIDLGGIAKGYAVDQAIRRLQNHGIGTACVNAGGDLRVLGDRNWPVLIRLPAAPRRAFLPVTIRQQALATTAHYFTARVENDRVVTPLIDPRTGRCRTENHNVSVAAPSCMLADALTKVVWLSGDAWHPLLARHRARAIVLPGEREGGCAGAA